MSIICLNMSLAMLEAGIRPVQRTLKSMSCNRLLDGRTESRVAFLRQAGSVGLQEPGGWLPHLCPQQNSLLWFTPDRCVTTKGHPTPQQRALVLSNLCCQQVSPDSQPKLFCCSLNPLFFILYACSGRTIFLLSCSTFK